MEASGLAVLLAGIQVDEVLDGDGRTAILGDEGAAEFAADHMTNEVGLARRWIRRSTWLSASFGASNISVT
jgi:hypothetical protein